MVQNESSAKSISNAKTPSWPGAFGIYNTSKKAILYNLLPILGLFAIAYGVNTFLSLVLKGIFFNILILLMTIPVSATLVYATLESVKGNTLNIGEAFSKTFSKAIDLIIASILMGIIAFVSIILFVVPFFFIFPRIYLTLFYILDKDMDAISALKSSWEDTRGSLGKIYGILGVTLLIFLPSITIIGIIATVYFNLMYYAASAILYMHLTKQKISE